MTQTSSGGLTPAAEDTQQMQSPRRHTHTHTVAHVSRARLIEQRQCRRHLASVIDCGSFCQANCATKVPCCQTPMCDGGSPAPDSSCALTGLGCIETPRRDAMQPRHKCASSERVSLSTSKAEPQLLLSLMTTHVLRYNTTSHALTWLGFGRGLCEPLIGLCEPLAGVCATLLQSRLFSVPPLCPCAGSPSPATLP